MQYFVSIENSAYFYWQIELLLESFKMLKLQDSLVIGIAENEESLKPARFSKNIISHPHKFIHQNQGRKMNYLPLNKPYSLLLALENELIKPPFAVLHPDMILVKPLEFKKDEKESIVFHAAPEVEKELLDGIKPHLEELAKANNLDFEKLPPQIPLIGTMMFRDVDKKFFRRVLARTSSLLQQDHKWDVARGAWMITMYEYLAEYGCRGAYFEKRLIDHGVDANIIHYRKGLPPVFSKKFYGYKNLQMTIDPHIVLLEVSPTDTMHFVQEVVRSYQKKPPA